MAPRPTTDRLVRPCSITIIQSLQSSLWIIKMHIEKGKNYIFSTSFFFSIHKSLKMRCSPLMAAALHGPHCLACSSESLLEFEVCTEYSR